RGHADGDDGFEVSRAGDAVPRVGRRNGDGDVRVVVSGLAAVVAVGPVAVGDGVGVLAGRGVHGCLEVGEGVAVGLIEDDLAVLADRVGDLHVQGDLQSPASVPGGQWLLLSDLVPDVETRRGDPLPLVALRERGEAPVCVVRVEVRLDVRVAVG